MPLPRALTGRRMVPSAGVATGGAAAVDARAEMLEAEMAEVKTAAEVMEAEESEETAREEWTETAAGEEAAVRAAVSEIAAEMLAEEAGVSNAAVVKGAEKVGMAVAAGGRMKATAEAQAVLARSTRRAPAWPNPPRSHSRWRRCMHAQTQALQRRWRGARDADH